MKTIIRITKQEAIDAYKETQGLKDDVIVEIDEIVNHRCSNLPNFMTGTQYLAGNGGLLLPSCPLCGKYGQHVCVT